MNTDTPVVNKQGLRDSTKYIRTVRLSIWQSHNHWRHKNHVPPMTWLSPGWPSVVSACLIDCDPSVDYKQITIEHQLKKYLKYILQTVGIQHWNNLHKMLVMLISSSYSSASDDIDEGCEVLPILRNQLIIFFYETVPTRSQSFC